MIVKTIVQGLMAAAVIAAAGLAWAEGTAPPMPATDDGGPQEGRAVAGGGETGYLPAILGGRHDDHDRDDDRDDHDRDQDHDRDHDREDDDA